MAEGLRSILGRALRDAREQAGIRQIDVATRAGVHETVVGRFERGQQVPERLDEIIDAYSVELRIVAPELLQLAVNLWWWEINDEDA